MGKLTPALFSLLALALLSCGLWQPYAAMQDPQPTAAGTLTETDLYERIETPTPAPKSCQVTAAEALNLRSGPGISYPVKAWLKPGDLLTVITQLDGWAKITTPTGAAGWVNLNYCKGR